MIDRNRPGTLSAQLGFWSASLSAAMCVIFTVCFAALIMINPLFMWTDLAHYVAYVNEYHSPIPDVARFAMLMLGLLFVILLNSIHDYARPDLRILARISLGFGVAFAALTGAHYFVQISAVRLNMLKGQLDGLEQIVQANPYSAMSAINMLGWTLFLGLASLFVAPIFYGGRTQRIIRIAFSLNGCFCLLGAVGYVFEQTVLLFLTINLGMGGALLTVALALAYLFRRIAQDRA